MSAFTVTKVEPIGTKLVTGFRTRVDGCGGLEQWEEPKYPPAPKGEAFRLARVAVGLTLRDAADRLGLSPEIISGLEHGRYEFADPDDWDLAGNAIRMGT